MFFVRLITSVLCFVNSKILYAKLIWYELWVAENSVSYTLSYHLVLLTFLWINAKLISPVLPWPQRLSFILSWQILQREPPLLFFIGTKHWELRKESLWSRSLRISLSCWLSTWQLSKMSFSFDQSHPQGYLIHPIIWLVEQLKISSNQKRQSKADGMKEYPNGRDQRLSFLSARHSNQHFVPCTYLLYL